MAKKNLNPGEKKVKLKLLQRLLLDGSLLQQGNKADVILLKDVSTKIGLTQRELKDYNIRFTENSVTTNAVGGSKVFEFVFTELEVGVIKKSFALLDAQGKYSRDLIDVEALFD